MSKAVKKSYFTVIFLAIFVVPLSLMFSLYTHMLIHLRDNTRISQRIKLMEMGDMKHKVNINNNGVVVAGFEFEKEPGNRLQLN